MMYLHACLPLMQMIVYDSKQGHISSSLMFLFIGKFVSLRQICTLLHKLCEIFASVQELYCYSQSQKTRQLKLFRFVVIYIIFQHQHVGVCLRYLTSIFICLLRAVLFYSVSSLVHELLTSNP